MIRLAAGLVALSATLLLQTTVTRQPMKLGEVLLFSAPDLPPDAGAKAFAELLTRIAPKRSEPGVAVYLLQADRGAMKGQYSLVWTIDTLTRRREHSAQVNAVKGNVEYHLVAPGTVGALPEVDVLGLHYTKVRPERVEAFDRFVSEKLHPAVGNLRPDLRILYYKAVQGADAGSYIALFALTRASRDKYWPGGSDSDDLRAAFKPVQGLTKELSTISRGRLVPRGSQVCRRRLRKPPVGGLRARVNGRSLTSGNQTHWHSAARCRPAHHQLTDLHRRYSDHTPATAPP